MTSIIVFAGIVLSLFVYIVAAWNARNASSGTADDYYLAKGTARPTQFAVAQTAYQLQMATIYPFFLFALLGNWWIGAANSIGYFIGIGILFALLPLFNRGSSAILGQSSTVHAAIANLHSFPFLRQLTAWLTVIAFAGLAAFEITWGARVFRAMFDGGDSVYYLAIITLATYLVLYVWAGGQRANIGAAQFQLLFSYVGLHSLVAWVVLQAGVSLKSAPFLVIVPTIVFLALWMLLIRLRTHRQLSSLVLKYLNVFTVLSLLVMLGGIVPKLTTLQPSSWKALTSVQTTPSFWLIALSVGLLPLFSQFVDTSNWQRFSSLISSPSTRLSEARRGLYQFLIESPLSWLLPILIGLCAAQFLVVQNGQDPWDALLGAVLKADGAWSLILPLVVFVGIVAIFMSTANELLTTIAYVYAYDISRKSRRLAVRNDLEHDNSVASVVYNSGRGAMVVATALVIGLFIIFDLLFKGTVQTLIGMFLAFYGPLIALAPSLVVPAVTGRVANSRFALASLAGGAGSGLFFGLWSAVAPTAFDGDITWYGSLAAVIVSWMLYLVGMFGGTRVPEGVHNGV